MRLFARDPRALLRRTCLFLAALWFTVLATVPPARAASTTPAWVGEFTDFNSPAWRMKWGITSDDLKCEIAVGSTTCNWGYQNLKTVADPGVPGGAHAIEVTYPAPSGPPSCKCGIGGAQLYQELKNAGLVELTQSQTVDLKYYYRFPVGFDFGKNTGGKLPGLYGGPPGCESGGVRCDGAWSTRYMWRGGSKQAPNGEVYWYASGGSGFGEDLGVGKWRWLADGQWHSIEQLLDLGTGKITIWHDGQMVFETSKSFGKTPFTGIFFSTFHGGHDTGWSPSQLTTAQFARFSISTDGPQVDGTAPPPPVADAGSVPPLEDAGAPAVDASRAATGGSGGGSGSSATGGTGGSATGSSGATGGTAVASTGGSAGGGARPTPPPATPAESGPTTGGCSVAGAATAAHGAWPLLVLALVVARGRRRRGR